VTAPERNLSKWHQSQQTHCVVLQVITLVVCELQGGIFYQNVAKTSFYLTTLYNLTGKNVCDSARGKYVKVAPKPRKTSRKTLFSLTDHNFGCV